MEYKGKLYGKVGGQIFPLLNTTDDWERMENRIKELEAKNEALKQANGAEQSESTCNLQNVSGLLFDFLFYVRGGTQDVPEDEIRREIEIFLANYKR